MHYHSGGSSSCSDPGVVKRPGKRPDLFISYVIMLFIATGNWLYLIAAGVLGKGATSIAYTLFDHVRRRFTAWKNPWADIDNTGYQITQSLFAIGTGGWFGMGLCQGMPNRIPVVEKDFILLLSPKKWEQSLLSASF